MKKAILSDAMMTIFIPRGGQTRYETMADLYEEFIGRRADPKDIERVYDQKRAYWEERLPPNHGEKWAVIIREVLLALWPDIGPERAMEVARLENDEFLSGHRIYEVVPDTMAFLKEASRRGMRFIIASNQDQERLQRIIAHFEVGKFFHAVYTSTEVGAEKPDPKFFQTLFSAERLRPDECVMVGNNPHNDVRGAERVGMTGVLYDTHNKYPDFSGYRIPHLNDIWRLDLFSPSRLP